MDEELLATLDAWREGQGMKRAEAVRYLLGWALGIDGADGTPNTLHNMSTNALFSEVNGDVGEMHDLATAEERECTVAAWQGCVANQIKSPHPKHKRVTRW